MLYQCNALASTCTALAGIILLYQYLTSENERVSSLFWFHRCEPEFNCVEQYFTGSPLPWDKELIAAVKEWLIPPPKYRKTEYFDIDTPVWRKLVDWNKVQESLIDAFQHQPPGNFVEVGAVDGDFMSQTLYLEKNLNWSGLLIEPDPRSFRDLVKSGRNAWLSPFCVYEGNPSVQKFWLRDLEDGLPHHFSQLLMARSRLYTETLEGDEERGSSVWVPCTPLTTILRAVQLKSVELLTMATGQFEDNSIIRDVLYSKNFHVKSLLIHFPTSVVYKTPYPVMKGYIIDLQRSQMLVKLYHKTSLCSFVSSSDCETHHAFDTAEACYKFLCFGYLTVKTVIPTVVQKSS